jgi:Bacterial Ig domain
MRILVFWLIGLGLLAASVRLVSAQLAPLSWSTGRLCWTWAAGPPPQDGQPNRLIVRCGTAPGLRDLPARATAIVEPPPEPLGYCFALRDLIPEPVSFPVSRYCAASAAMDTGEAVVPSAETAEIGVTVIGEVTDVTPPVVDITSPTTGSVVEPKSQVDIVAQVRDNAGVSEVRLFVANQPLCTRTAAPYQCPWQVPAPSGRSYAIHAAARDGAGNLTISEAVFVTAD